MRKSIVLNFHNETDGAMFEKIIIALKSRYQLVSIAQLEQLLLQKKVPDNVCHISFDDGEISFYNIIFPILKKHQVPVSLFLSPEIITGNSNFWFQEIKGYDSKILKDIILQKFQLPAEELGKYSPQDIFKNLTFKEIDDIINRYQQVTGCKKKQACNMSLKEVLEVEASGLVTIGAHTLNHPILKNEDDKTSFAEISQSVEKLQQLLGHPIKYFAYPNGRPQIDFGIREINYLKESGITLAFSTELNYLQNNLNRLRIPRMGYARMGLSPINPLIYFRLSLGSKWINIKSIGKPSEKMIRKKINALLKRN